MGVFHIFWIMQMVLYRPKRLIYCELLLNKFFGPVIAPVKKFVQVVTIKTQIK